MKITRFWFEIDEHKINLVPRNVTVDDVEVKIEWGHYTHYKGKFNLIFLPATPVTASHMNRIIEHVILKIIDSAHFEDDMRDATFCGLIERPFRIIRLGAKREMVVQYEAMMKMEVGTNNPSCLKYRCAYGKHNDLNDLILQNLYRIDSEHFEMMQQ